MSKEITIKAIESDSSFADSEKKVLIELVKIAVQHIAIVSTQELIEYTNCSRTSVYMALKKLQNEGVITKLHNKLNSYQIQKDKIDFLVSIYNNKQ